MQVIPGMYCGQEFGGAAAMPNYGYTSSMFYRGVPPNGSPPWRPDDKDGHFVFVVGETLTPRCELFSAIVKLRLFQYRIGIHCNVFVFFFLLVVECVS